MLCSRNATANVATSITAGDWPRSGRKTSRSIASESASTTAKQSRIPPSTGQPHSDASASAYAPAMISCAVGEVDEPQDAEDEPDPDRHQRVDRAERRRVGERLPVDVEDREQS